MITIVADLLTEEGRKRKLLIPPNTTKPCHVLRGNSPVYIQSMRFELYVSISLAKRSLQLVQVRPLKDVSDLYTLKELLLYNGGWESQWIEHGEAIVNIYEFRN